MAKAHKIAGTDFGHRVTRHAVTRRAPAMDGEGAISGRARLRQVYAI
jgi:hypothetical protein